MSPVSVYRAVVVLYAVLGIVLALLFSRVSRDAEVSPSEPTAMSGFARLFGIHKSRGVVAKLSALFAVDAFAGGFAAQTFASYWFYLRFGVNPAMLRVIFVWAN